MNLNQFLNSEILEPQPVMQKNAEWVSGTRVAFMRSMESLFTYTDCPNPGVLGSVIRIRTASGDSTTQDGYVFIKWDDNVMRPILKRHLHKVNLKIANSYRLRVAGLGDLTDFLRCGSDLVHKATKDLWALKKEGDEVIIERLFTDDGSPLKV
jgi:hypothetical protein